MTNEVIVGLLSLGGTVIGTFTGILTSTNLVKYRLAQLEKKVELHNNAMERLALAEKEVKVIWHSIDEIKDDLYK